MNSTPYQITHLGHGSNLLRLGDQYFLTDPNFSPKIFLKGNRAVPPGMKPQDLPKISAIIISHACYDHLDIFSYKYFSNHTPIVCPKGVGAFIKRF
ncbi:MAG: hypothetical protein KDK66_05300 [Deltaproteobacteria bacterium]|nr:hypothetical protein [Deltaproteobacteria bacterium]